MRRIKFVDVLKYVLLKSFLTSIVIPITDVFSREGKQVMQVFIAGTIYIGIVSLPLIYAMVWLGRKVKIDIDDQFGFVWILVIAVNEGVDILFNLKLNYFSAFTSGKQLQVTYKVTDLISILLSAFLCIGLRDRLRFKKEGTT